MQHDARVVLATVCLVGLLPVAMGQPIPVSVVSAHAEPVPVFLFAMGAHGLTGEALLGGQQELKEALGYGTASDPNDMLVFEGAVETGGVLQWWLSGQQIAVTDVFREYEVVRTEDNDGHQIVLLMLSVRLQNGENSSHAYLMVLRDDTLEVGAALPITFECWEGFFVFGRFPLPAPRAALTCAEEAVDWCNDWYPPCSGGSGIGGIIECAEQAACRNADCHHLACIYNANECCESGYSRTACWWIQWLTAGQNLEHVTCDIIYAMELAACIPKVAIKGLFS